MSECEGKEASHIFDQHGDAMQRISDIPSLALFVQDLRMFQCIRIRLNNAFEIGIDLSLPHHQQTSYCLKKARNLKPGIQEVSGYLPFVSSRDRVWLSHGQKIYPQYSGPVIRPQRSQRGRRR